MGVVRNREAGQFVVEIGDVLDATSAQIIALKHRSGAGVIL